MRRSWGRNKEKLRYFSRQEKNKQKKTVKILKMLLKIFFSLITAVRMLRYLGLNLIGKLKEKIINIVESLFFKS